MAEPAGNAVPSPRMSNTTRLVPASGDFYVHVRISTRHKARYLNNIKILDFVDRAVKQIFPMMAIPVQAYCILPDRLHLILKCNNPQELHHSIYRFTKTTGLISLRRFKIHLWQWEYSKSFLYSQEQKEKASRIIMSLPEALGLTEEQGHYPFRGSLS